VLILGPDRFNSHGIRFKGETIRFDRHGADCSNILSNRFERNIASPQQAQVARCTVRPV
jgi:hypothetical protein